MSDNLNNPVNVLFVDSDTSQSVAVSADNPLPVEVDVQVNTISGTVTANAGTNLNTSALATQATLASILASIGAAGDVVGANTVIGQLKQIAENTTP